MPKPQSIEYPAFFETYIKLVTQEDVLQALKSDSNFDINFFQAIPIEKQEYRYAEGKWTMKEMLQHIIDTERIFAYRALVFARQDKTVLPGFDENLYAVNSSANTREWNQLIDELISVRQTSIQLFASFVPEAITYKGTASAKEITVNAIGFIICGHLLHHKNITMERYL